MSTRWVLSEKMKDGKTITKARLVACSFEEQKNDTMIHQHVAKKYYEYH